jgi:hypothetical protein
VPHDQDPEVVAAVAADYRAEVRSIERKAKVMGYDRGRQYRRLAHAALRGLKELNSPVSSLASPGSKRTTSPVWEGG